MDDTKKTDGAELEKKAPVKMVKVRVLRPFQVFVEGQPVLHDRIGALVEVPKTDIPRLTEKVKGQAKGFGHTTDEENAEHHNLQLAELVAA